VSADVARDPTYSWDMERSLLGGLILDPSQIPDIAEVIRPGDFHMEAHAALFRILHRMHEAGQGIDVALVMDEVIRLDCAREVDGFAYVGGLPALCPSVENLPDYATRLRELGTRRAMVLALERSVADIKAGADIREVIASAGAVVSEASEATAGKERPRFVMVGETARAVMAEIHAAADETAPKSERVLIPTGFTGLDKMLIGFEPGDLVIIGGRSGMGKSAFVGNLAINRATAGYGVAIHSAEMARHAIVRRLMAAVGRASASQMRAGKIDTENYRRLVEAAEKLDTMPIAIDDGKGATIADLRNRIKRLSMPGGRRVSVVAVDYLQLLKPAGRGGNREGDVAAIARGLKELAAELQVVMLALSQISRGVEGRQDKRPGMADLRESGEIEQAADAILLLYRDDYYHPDTTQKGIAEAILAKLREGRTGTVPLAWLADYLLFQTLVTEGAWSPPPLPKAPKGKGRRDIEDPDEDGSFY